MALVDVVSPVTALYELDLEPALDLHALAAAWRQVCAEHPIVGTRLDVADDRSVWAPIGDVPPILQTVPPEGLSAATRRIRACPLDIAQGPSAELHCLSTDTSSRLVLVFHHAALDGQGAFTLLDRTRTIYSALSDGRAWNPLPVASARSVGDVLTARNVPPMLRERIVSTALRRWSRLRPSSHWQPAGPGPATVSEDMAVIDLTDLIARSNEVRTREGWTMTMLLLGVIEYAWNEAFGPRDGPSGWLVTNDLRPRLSAQLLTGNLSGAEPIMFENAPTSPLEGAAAANAAWNAIRWPGLAPELIASAFRWRPAEAGWGPGIEAAFSAGRRHGYTRVFSNLGRVPAAVLDWGTASAQGVRVIPPLATAPYVAFGLVTVGGTTQMSFRVSPGFFTADHAARLEAALMAAPVG